MPVSSQVLFVLMLLLTACGGKQNSVTVTGKARGLEGIVRLSTGDSILAAEHINEDGTFGISGIVTEPGFYILELFEKGRSEKTEFLTYLDKEPVEVVFDVSDLEKYPRISGTSVHQRDINKLYSKLNPALQGAEADYQKAKRALETKSGESPDSSRVMKLIEDFNAAEQRRTMIRDGITENYILNNPSSLLSAYLLYHSEERIAKKPVIYHDLFEKLSPEIKRSVYGKRAKALISRILDSRKN